jgi:hypothetical protein
MSSPAIHKLLQDMAARNGGRLTPDDVVAEAKKKSSILHEYFERQGAWDRKKAQAQYCIIVARELIRSVQLTIQVNYHEVRAPAFVRDPTARPAQGYATIQRLRSDEDLAKEAVEAEFARADAALQRAYSLAEVLGLSGEIDQLRSSLGKLNDKLAA